VGWLRVRRRSREPRLARIVVNGLRVSYTARVSARRRQDPSPCRRCGLPEGRVRVRIDRDGVCNHCRFWDTLKQTFVPSERGPELLARRLTQFGDQYPYDVAAGLSGGKDSAYVLYRLVSDYGLRVLAVTYDNGFLTEYARANIRSIVQSTGVKHFFYRPNPQALQAFYRAALRRAGDPCLACSVGGYALSIKGCLEKEVPFFAHGRSPLQMFRHAHRGTRDLGIGLLRANIAEHSFDRLARQYRGLLRRLRWFLRLLEPNRARRETIRREFFSFGRVPNARLPEFLAFFLYEPYDERAIKTYLEGHETGYRRPQDDVPLGHADCQIHAASEYLHELRHGISKVALEAAALVRQGQVTRQEAEEIVAANKPSRRQVEEAIEHLLERLEMPRREFDAICARFRARQNRFSSG
jgi:hypothetical protein